MSDSDIVSLRNVLVLVMIDGQVTDEEKRFVHRLRKQLGIGGDQFNQICDEARHDRKGLTIPSGGTEAEKALGLLINAAKVDGLIDPAEQKLLEKVAQYIDRDAAKLEAMIVGDASPVDRESVDLELEAAINTKIDELYACFSQWSEDQRREHCDALGALGGPAVIPLLRVLESYRNADGGGGLAMKELIVDQLAILGDDAAVYYMAQQVTLWGSDDEVTCESLRAAAAEAIGKIVGTPFTRDAQGVEDCAEWWRGTGAAEFRTLVL